MTERAVCVIGAGLIGGSLLRAADKAGRTVWGTCASAETARQAARRRLRRHHRHRRGAAPGRRGRRAGRAGRAAAGAARRAAPGRRGRADLPADRRGERQGRPSRRRCAGTRRGPVTSAGTRWPAPRSPAGPPGTPACSPTRPGWWPPTTASTSRCGPTSPSWPGPAARGWCRPRPTSTTCAVAKVSHLPHLIAAVLAAVGAAAADRATMPAAGARLAASSFADGTRVAGTRPELVLAMCEGNRDAAARRGRRRAGPAGRDARGAGLDRRAGGHGARRPRGRQRLAGCPRPATVCASRAPAPPFAELREHRPPRRRRCSAGPEAERGQPAAVAAGQAGWPRPGS